MAYDVLKTTVQNALPDNTSNEISAADVRSSILAVINSLGAEYQFGGGAEPTDSPGTPDYKVAYLASTPGTYSNFGGFSLLPGQIAIAKWNGEAWESDVVFESGAVFDVTQNNNGAKFASLGALLSSGNLSTLIPAGVRTGGMSIKFVRSYDNRYLQYRLTANAFSSEPRDWESTEEYKDALAAQLVLDEYNPPLTKNQYWGLSDGVYATSIYYVRSTYRLGGVGYRNAMEMQGNTYIYSLVYEKNDTVVGSVSRTSGITFFPKDAEFVKINFRRVDNAAMTNEDVSAISAALKLYKYTDASLTMQNVPADAKASGEAISAVVNTADGIINYLLNELDFVPTLIRGSYWAFADGSVIGSNKFIRTYRLFGAGQRSAIRLTDDAYQYSLVYENANKEVVGTKDPTTGLTFFPDDAYYVCVNFKRADLADVTDADVAAIAANVKFYSSERESNIGEEATDNLFDINAFSTNADKVGFILYGTAAQLDGKTILDISELGGATLNFEWDYKNNGGVTSSIGPCLVALDANGDAVNVESVTSGNTVNKILLSNFRDYVHRSFAYIFPATAQKIVFGINGEPDETTYYFRHIKITKLPKEAVRKIPDFYPHWSYPDFVARAGLPFAGLIHDGATLQMATTPEAIPVGENHIGYNDFIATTWDTLLPDDYQEGDAYDESTTKIHGVRVERESRWESTPYGANTDTYTIYRYIFTPQTGYDKTVFLTSGCHGNEAEGYWGLYRLIRMIYFEGYKYPTLRNLRNVRFIIVPSWNPWGFQHYRRYNAFSALNVGGVDVAKGLQAWSWLIAPTHQKTVDGVVYDITDVGEANVIYETLNEFGDALSLWVDLHTDPYAGRDTTNVDIDDPRGYTPPYGCYGYAPENSKSYVRMFGVMDDFFNIFKERYSFTETWHPRATNPNSTNSFTGWQSTLGLQCALVEISTFMDNFPYASGSGEMMKIAQEFYGNCIAEMLR